MNFRTLGNFITACATISILIGLFLVKHEITSESDMNYEHAKIMAKSSMLIGEDASEHLAILEKYKERYENGKLILATGTILLILGTGIIASTNRKH